MSSQAQKNEPNHVHLLQISHSLSTCLWSLTFVRGLFVIGFPVTVQTSEQISQEWLDEMF